MSDSDDWENEVDNMV